MLGARGETGQPSDHSYVAGRLGSDVGHCLSQVTPLVL